jgi:Zn-dependent protease
MRFAASSRLTQALGMYSERPGFSKAICLLGVPFYLHWSFPLGAALPCFVVGFRVEQSIYLCAGYLLLIAIHEIGHAVAAKAYNLDVLAVEISGFGGTCRIEEPRTVKSALVFASGGLLAQLILLLLTGIFLALFGSPPTLFLNCLVLVFTLVNIILFVGNIVPGKSVGGSVTDGYLIWHGIRLLRAGHA